MIRNRKQPRRFTRLLATLVAAGGLLGGTLGVDSNAAHGLAASSGTASVGEYPFFASVIKTNASGVPTGLCSGSLVAPDLVLTAAHCVRESGATVAASRMKVTLGRVVRADSATATPGSTGADLTGHTVSQVIQHELYGERDGAWDHDIALLRLSTPSKLPPVQIASRWVDTDLKTWDAPECRLGVTPCSWKLARAVGQGITPSDSSGGTVREGSTFIVDDSTANGLIDNLFSDDFKANVHVATTGDAMICSGDSGGPLLTLHPDGTWRQVGVASWAPESCSADNAYSVYARISGQELYTWLKAKMSPSVVAGTTHVDRVGTTGVAAATQLANFGKYVNTVEGYEVTRSTGVVDPFVFTLSEGTGDVAVYGVDYTGRVVVEQPLKRYHWTAGWTDAKFWSQGTTTYMLLYKAGSGLVHIHTVKADGTITQIASRSLPVGISSMRLVSGTSGRHLVTVNHSKLTVYPVNTNGTIATATAALGQESWGQPPTGHIRALELIGYDGDFIDGGFARYNPNTGKLTKFHVTAAGTLSLGGEASLPKGLTAVGSYDMHVERDNWHGVLVNPATGLSVTVQLNVPSNTAAPSVVRQATWTTGWDTVAGYAQNARVFRVLVKSGV